MDRAVLEDLSRIDVSALSYNEWLEVGMALKYEGCSCGLWDEWSREDPRYHPGECEKKWETFSNGAGSPVTGATIRSLAREYGGGGSRNVAMSWTDEIEYDGDSYACLSEPEEWHPAEELETFLRILFRPDDIVGYVTNDVWQDERGDWNPGKGVYTRTAGEILAALEKHPDDLGAAIDDWKPEAGAWIRFNPLDGQGVKNENVTEFRFALVESDTIPVGDQEAIYRKLQLPIATMVYSGGKSIHALVRVDAPDYEEYRKRVQFLYDYLKKNGVDIDTQNRNPSRMTRMPGVTRKGNRQYLVAVNIGRRSWADWLDYVEGEDDELPEILSFADYLADPLPLAEEMISGILRRGHKMLISGASKAGKSFLLLELAVAIAEGLPWLGWQCRQGKVLYVNLEIDPASFGDRVRHVYNALAPGLKNVGSLMIWNLRGHAQPLDKLVPKIVRKTEGMHLDAIILDPIYKIITGDENSASDMGAFCNELDRIASQTGASVIYCHHHSKGGQGNRKAIDRASGSGVFGRDPDAQIDMTELVLTDEVVNFVSDRARAFRVEATLREFPAVKPVDVWFEYPLHRIDTTGALAQLPVEGSPEVNLLKSPNHTTKYSRRDDLDRAYDAVADSRGTARIRDVAEYLNLTDRTVRNYLAEFDDDYTTSNGFLWRESGSENGCDEEE